MQDLGLAIAKSTKSDNLKQLVAQEKALNEKMLEKAPTWWLAFAAFDNLVALPKTTSNARATIQPFLFFARPLASNLAGLHPPGETVQPPSWKPADEQLFTKINFIYGYDAIEEELKALPRPPALQSARVHHVAVVEALPKPFVGASRLPNRESSLTMQIARIAFLSGSTLTWATLRSLQCVTCCSGSRRR